MSRSTQKLRLATRGSLLALAQSQWVADQLMAQKPELRVELVAIKTQGDLILDRPLREVGGKGLFTKGVEQALLDQQCDLAVHSLKDMDSLEPPGLSTVAFPSRQDPRDVVVTKAGGRFTGLLPTARIGTGALRRVAQLRLISERFQLLPLRGNINSRLARLDCGDFDAIMLAAAGLKRAGLEARIGSGALDIMQVLPAPGQGILAVQMREDHQLASVVQSALDHRETRQAATAERAFLAGLGANCHSPVAAHCWMSEDGLSAHLSAFLAPTALGENRPLASPLSRDQVWRATHRFNVPNTEDSAVFFEAGQYLAERACREASTVLQDWHKH